MFLGAGSGRVSEWSLLTKTVEGGENEAVRLGGECRRASRVEEGWLLVEKGEERKSECESRSE